MKIIENPKLLPVRASPKRDDLLIQPDQFA